MFLCTRGCQDLAKLENGRQIKRSKIESLSQGWQGTIAVFLFLDSAVTVFGFYGIVGLGLDIGFVLIVGIGIKLVGI